MCVYVYVYLYIYKYVYIYIFEKVEMWARSVVEILYLLPAVVKIGSARNPTELVGFLVRLNFCVFKCGRCVLAYYL